MIDLTYTDSDGIEQGIIKAYQLDLAYGSDENDFELTLPIDMRIAEKSLVYIDGTEWGGIVRGGRESTMGETPVFVARGETWHGMLAETYICPAAVRRLVGRVRRVGRAERHIGVASVRAGH